MTSTGMWNLRWIRRGISKRVVVVCQVLERDSSLVLRVGRAIQLGLQLAQERHDLAVLVLGIEDRVGDLVESVTPDKVPV
jgi:hypothetical protein